MYGTEAIACPSWNRFSRDRKSTRLNSSHANFSYAVFCLKKYALRIPHLPSSSLSLPPTSSQRSLLSLPLHSLFSSIQSTYLLISPTPYHLTLQTRLSPSL